MLLHRRTHLLSTLTDMRQARWEHIMGTQHGNTAWQRATVGGPLWAVLGRCRHRALIILSAKPTTQQNLPGSLPVASSSRIRLVLSL